MTNVRRITRLTIERGKWLRGDSTSSCLLDGGGRMCCLGFAAIEAGVNPELLREQGKPEDVEIEIPVLTTAHLVTEDDGCEYERFRDTGFTDNAIEINDSGAMDDAVREAELTALFAAEGIELEFVP